MKQLDILEARRRALLARCDQQRIDLVYRLERIAPGRRIAGWISTVRRVTHTGMSSPFAFWGITLGLALLLVRPRKLLGRLAWITTVLSLVSRASHLVRLVARWRDLRSGLHRLRV